MADAILPGSNVTVSGPLKVGLWQDQAGVTHAASYLRVSTLQFLSGMGRGERCRFVLFFLSFFSS